MALSYSLLSAHCANMCYDIRAESPACRNHERTKKSKMKQNRVKQISIVMAAADVVDNGLSVSRNSVPKAQEIPSLDKQVSA